MKALVVGFVIFAGVAAAAPDTSQRPIGRGGLDPQPLESPVRPVARAAALQVDLAAAIAAPMEATLRPIVRPQAIEQKGIALRNERRKGQVCGDPDLQGEEVGPVPGRIKGCGIIKAVRLRSVSDVQLSQASLMDCNTAKALKRWTEQSAKKELNSTGGGLVGYHVAAHYACRSRNNQKGSRISEHGKGRAIDISAFLLRDGTRLTVLDDWNSRHGRKLKAMHKGACGPFGTVLGPRSDGFHRDHFHFDTARYRSGPYCR